MEANCDGDGPGPGEQGFEVEQGSKGTQGCFANAFCPALGGDLMWAFGRRVWPGRRWEMKRLGMVFS
jgi:hypothetical protein